MPEVKLPPATQTSDIKLFAKAYFNIDLTTAQQQQISDIVNGKHIRVSRRMGLTTADRVLKAYIKEGLDPSGRRRLPQHSLPPRVKIKGLTQEGKILAMIKQPGGAFNFELSRFALKYTSVISALRKDGHNIVAVRQFLKNGRASNTYRYFLLDEPI